MISLHWVEVSSKFREKTVLGEGTYKYIKYINDMQFCWQISLKSVINEADKSPSLGGEHEQFDFEVWKRFNQV